MQMKLTVVDDTAAPELVSNIAKFANSQNPVSAIFDLFSNHPYHVRIEENSRRIKANPVAGAQSEVLTGFMKDHEASTSMSKTYDARRKSQISS